MTTTQATVQGLVLEVSILPAGSKLIADHPISSTVLNLGDASAFDEAGGGVTVLGVPYLYNAVDPDQGTITLTTGLTTLVEEGTSVLLNPPGEEKWATIDQELGEDMIIARVPHWLADKLPDGIREESDRESVIIAVQYDGWTVTDIVGQQPAIDAQYIDAVPPDFTSDDLAPASSPQPTAIGGVGSFFLTWTPIANHDPVTYKVYGSASAGFTKDASTLIGTTTGSTMTVRALTGGTAFSWDTNYYFAVQAEDIDGAAPVSLESAGQMMVKITNEYVAANYVYAGEIFANQLRSGISTADITISGSFATAESGQRSVMDGFGIRQYGPDGSSVITDLPNNGNPKFTGIVNAFGLIVNGGLEFRGQNNLFAMGSITTLATTTSGSAIAPSITPSWETVNSGMTEYLYANMGYHREADGGNPVWVCNFFSYGHIHNGPFRYGYPEVILADGNKKSARSLFDAVMVRTATGPRLVTYGERWTAGQQNNEASIVRDYEVLDLSPMTANDIAPLSKYKLVHVNPNMWYIGFLHGRCLSPIGSSTLENQFAQCEHNKTTAVDQLYLRRYAVTDTSIIQQGSTVQVASPIDGNDNEGIQGVVYGSSGKMGFPGAEQNLWIVFTKNKAFGYSATGTRLTDMDFPLSPDTWRVNAVGSTGAGSNGFVRFESILRNNPDLLPATRYTNIHWASTDSSVWWAGYTWNDSAGTTHESDISAVAATTMPKRMRYTITAPNLPDPETGMGTARGPDDVNGIRVYMARQASAPTRTQLWKQTVQPADLETTITYDTMPQFSGTSNPPAVTNFIAQAAARLQSSAIGADGLPKVLIDGSGLLHSETLDVSGAGATSLQGKAFDQLYYSIRTQSLLAGGGMISVSASYEVKWSTRFISIARGRSASLATVGYFEILTPPAATVITGYGGATNKTVTANGIPLLTWDALYYVLPYGSSQASQNANFRVVNYTSDFTVPNDWILICLRNGDSGAVEFTTGDNVKVNQSVGGGWIDVPITNTTNWKQYNAGIHPQIRRAGNVVYFRGAISPNSAAGVTAVQSSTIDANSLFTTIPAGYRPSASAEAQQPVWVCQGSTNDRWALRVYDAGGAYAHRYGEGTASTSTWLPFSVSWLLD